MQDTIIGTNGTQWRVGEDQIDHGFRSNRQRWTARRIKAYPVTEGAAVKAGVTYEIADGTSIPNLGERQAAVMNINGTVAAKHQQVAGVSHHLTAVRQEMKAGKMVVFDSEGCYTLNKFTG